MTTFAPLTTSSATLAATSAITFAPMGAATLPARGALGAELSVLSGGVLQRYAQSTLLATGAIIANAGSLRQASATLSAALSIRHPDGGVATFLPMSGLAANKAYAGGVAYIGPFEGLATDPLPIPSFGLAVANFEPMQGLAAGITGEVGSATVNLALAALASNRPYAGSALPYSILGMRLWSYGDEGESRLEYTQPQYLYGYGWFETEAEYATTSSSSVEVSDTYEPVRITDEAFIDVVMASAAVAPTIIIVGNIVDVLTVVGVLGRRDTMSVWAVNMKTKASSIYENFEFNSIASYNGRYFIATDNGLYELGGDSDDGEPIIAAIMTGKLDFDTSAKKRVFATYAGIDSTSDLTLSVFTDDGQRNDYVLTATSGLQSTRTLIGRGLYSRYWQFMVSNPDGEMFEIESLEVLPALASRRV